MRSLYFERVILTNHIIAVVISSVQTSLLLRFRLSLIPPSSPSPIDFMDSDSGSFDVFGFVAAENYFSNLTNRKLFLEVEEGCIFMSKPI
jgi:hypothetical protein